MMEALLHGRRPRWAAALLVAMAGYLGPQAVGRAATGAAPHSAVRLLDGGAGPGHRLAGVEIRLDRGFITYWRSAGEAGVPPVFDFSGSVNLKEAKVAYPAPRLLDEDGIAAYGYEDNVTFPIEVTAQDGSRPVRLDLALGYAVCSKLCLPATAHLEMTLDAAGPKDVDQVRDALARVPKPALLAGDGPLGIEAVAWSGTTTLSVKARVPDGAGTLFAEAPDLWYFTVSPGRPSAAGKDLDFVLTGPDHPPSGPPPGDPLRLTLVTPSGAIEVSLRLDAIAAKP